MTDDKKDKDIVLAVCYDFDKTLSPDDMQAQGFIQSLGQEVENFWSESNKLASDNDMDQNLAWMYKMTKESRGKHIFNKKTLKEYGSNVDLYPGVSTWFDRINKYGEEKGIIVEHYIISSGLKEMIEGTEVAKYFKKIYASSFYFDEYGVAVWPAQCINYTNKTQFLFRIKKGALEINDTKVNDYLSEDQFRVPFRNMVYIGDSDTDIPCMKLVSINGGYSIGVHGKESKNKVFKMIEENRIKYFTEADYSEDSELEKLLKNIIDRTAANEILEMKSVECVQEMMIERRSRDEQFIQKEDLIDKLNESSSFAETHEIIKLMSDIDKWEKAQIERILEVATLNSQVKYILKDNDIKEFYVKISQGTNSIHAKKVRELMEK
ncbi:HAD family hydrolase [Filifactor alocis]|uniref:HAD family hydrolase n=1 Tax=Filifactor alocis TaxID=143361 RepID=UPI0028D73DB2|nr:HAD family hydrolase [Filifactor alocis]